MSATHTPAADAAEQNGQPHPPADPAEPVADRFHRLAAEWRERVEYISSMTVMINDPAYQEIIRMGWEVVPVIIDDLRREPDWWFTALRQITGENPAPPDAAGKLGRLAEAWIDWWDRSHGR